MERRGFIKGVFGGVTSAGLLIAGNHGDLEAFAAPLVRQAPLIIDVEPVQRPQPAAVGEHLYNSRGELVAIVTTVHVERPSVEVTSAFDSNRLFVPGPQTFRIEAQGVGSIVFDRDAQRLEFHGVPSRR